MYQITEVIYTSILVMVYMWTLGFLLFLAGDKELGRLFLSIGNGNTVNNETLSMEFPVLTPPMEFPVLSDECEELSFLNAPG